MFQRPTRRRFLETAAAGGSALGLPSLAGLFAFGPANADEVNLPPDTVRYSPDIEPIVRLIEETPREKCVAALVEQLRGGLPYRRFLAAIFLAAIRKTNPHHQVYLVNAAHQISLDLRSEERLLPLFWAADAFKGQQQFFPTPPLKPLQGPLPPVEKATAELHEAMRTSQTDRGERAVVALARSEGPRQAMELLWHYSCRDGSLIGHRAISVTSCWRALETIGWQHAEPVLRFVIWDLHSRGGGPDRTYRTNLARVDQLLPKLPFGWAVGKADRAATLEMFAPLRQGQSDQACELAAKQLAAGFGARPIWDALHVAAAELMMLHAGSTGMNIRPLHANTTVNALHFAFNACSVAQTRLLILLQATAWVADFIRVQLGDKALAENKPLELAGAQAPASAGEGVEEVFAQLPPRVYKTGSGHNLENRPARMEIGRKMFALVNRHPEAAALYMQAARSWLCLKATGDAHEYKLPAALFEDHEGVSPEWRSRLLAASVQWLHGKQSPDSVVIQQAREALLKTG